MAGTPGDRFDGDHARADDDGMAQIRADMDRDPLDRPGGAPKTVTVKWRSVRTLLGRLFG